MLSPNPNLFLSGDVTRSSPVLNREYGNLDACSFANILRGVLGTRVNPLILVGYVWTGKFEYGKEELRIQKYPDTCAQGLTVYPGTLKINRPVTVQVQTKESVCDKLVICDKKVRLWYFLTHLLENISFNFCVSGPCWIHFTAAKLKASLKDYQQENRRWKAQDM